MKELYRLLGIETAPSTAYHPQTDGQTERVNQELEQFIQIFVGERQDDWYSLLPLAEFSYNNHDHSSTQHTPFLLDTGRHPRMGFEPHQPPSKAEAVNEITDRMRNTLEEAKSALAKAKDDMAKYYNQWQTPAPVYMPGDKVYLDASDIHTTRPSKKTVPSPPWTIPSGKTCWNECLPLGLATVNETPSPSIQCSQVDSSAN